MKGFKEGDMVLINERMEAYSSRIKPGTRAKLIERSIDWAVVMLVIDGKLSGYKTSVPLRTISPLTVLDRLTEI